MRYNIHPISAEDARRIIMSHDDYAHNDPKVLDDCLARTTHLWIGEAESPVCIWGLAPPTLLSTRAAYLWHIMLSKNKFALVRNSRAQIDEMLHHYKVLYGHCETDEPRSQGWLRWLGANLGKPEGRLTPFVITRG